MKKTETGAIPQGDGWFVLNARDVSWIQSEERGQDTDFEGGQDWRQLGFRIQVLSPGQRACITASPARRTSWSSLESACS
ncbi:MAG: hypothetical protein ACTHKS_17705 [Gaiellaceae bacterium]